MANLTFTGVGDAIITRRLSRNPDPGLAALASLIRQADARFVNLEIMTPRDPLVPSSEYGGLHLAAEPAVLDELTGLGFNLFNVANNHACDYTVQGLVDTMRELHARGIAFAGGGMTLGEARAPAYLETPAGRVALLAAASSYTTGALAADARTDMPGRPGINPLRIETEYVLDEAHMQMLKELDRVLGTAAVTERRRRTGTGVGFKEGAERFLGADFFAGAESALRTKAKARDLDAICRWIADARRQADFVVMSLHAHHGRNGDGNNPEMADFFPEVAHRCIDAGADVFVNHGPHMLRPIEVYQGKPIFYSLGNFIFQYEGVHRLPTEMYERHGLGGEATPADVYDAWERSKDGNLHGFPADPRFWQSVLPVCRFEGGRLAQMDLHPVVLGVDAPRTRRGDPSAAGAEAGTDILDRLAAACAPFGVELRVETSAAGVVGRASWG